MNKLTAVVALALAPLMVPTAASAQYYVGGQIPVGPSTPATFTPTQTFSAPVQTQVVSSPVIFANPVLINTVNPVFPKDITNPLLPKVLSDKLLNGKGVKIVPGVALAPSDSKNDSGLIAKGETGASFEKLGPTHFKLQDGAMLLSLKGSSNEASVDTPDGLVHLRSEGDVVISYIGSVLRVENISAIGHSCRVQVEKGIMGEKEQVLALAPGYELVISDRALMSGEIRPADEIARRKFYVFDNGQVAVNEFSVDSIIAASPVISSIYKSDNIGKKETRIIGDMLKMAAVMNHIHGPGGYTVAPASGIATKPGVNPQ